MNFTDIKRRLDGSYEITLNGLPYHTFPGHPKFDEVDAYALAHPDEVTVLTPPPPPTLDELKAAKRAEILNAKHAEENAGYTADGVTFDTSDRSKILWQGAYALAKADPDFTTAWKTKDGQFVTLSAAAVIAAYEGFAAFLEALFQKEAQLNAQIDAAASEEELDALSWN
jgi:hypothetical protein